MIAVALLLVSCSTSKDAGTTTQSSEKMALGWLHRSDFVTPEYPLFGENYDSAHIEPQFVDMIHRLQDGIEVVVVFGTWCGDSKQNVPRFLKLADLASIPSERIRFYGVDRSKKSSDGVTERYHIERVPTFIFLKNGNEVGRIVESPKHSMEDDVLAILADAMNK